MVARRPSRLAIKETLTRGEPRVSLGDTSRLGLIGAERSRAIRERLVAVRFAERAPLPAEFPDSVGVPKELRVPLIAHALIADGRPSAVLSLLLQYRAPVAP